MPPIHQIRIFESEAAANKWLKENADNVIITRMDFCADYDPTSEQDHIFIFVVFDVYPVK